MKQFHICQSIAGLERLMKKRKKITWLTIDGRSATNKELREVIKEAKSKGYTVIPPCDNVKPTGHCAGHEIQNEYETAHDS